MPQHIISTVSTPEKAIVAPWFFNPHLLLELPLTKEQAAALFEHWARQDAYFLYEGQRCSFQHHLLAQGSKCADTVLAALQLNPAFLYEGRIQQGQRGAIGSNNEVLASGVITEVLDARFSYWSIAQLPEPVQGSEQFSPDLLECYSYHLESELLELDFIEDCEVRTPKTGDYQMRIELTLPEGRISLDGIQKLYDILQVLTNNNLFFKAAYGHAGYTIPGTALLDSFSAEFILAIGKRYALGHIRVMAS